MKASLFITLSYPEFGLESVKDKLEDYQANKNQAVLDGITKHDLSGAMLQATVQSYFAINDAQDTIAVKQSKKIVANRFMSYGTFHTFIKPTMRYGVSFGGRMIGMQMDIDKLKRMAVAKDNNLDTLASFNQSQGGRGSANEHLVPEMMFDNPDTAEKEVNGISAVKAIQLAQEQGQKIFTITKDNYNEAISQINLSSGAMSDISNAINAGKTVTTHQSNINFYGWNGSGYIILDPTTGTGAYLIDGGANGAICMAIGLFFSSLLLLSLEAADAANTIKLTREINAHIGAAVLLILASMAIIYKSYQMLYGQDAADCFALGVSIALFVHSGNGIRIGKGFKSKAISYLIYTLEFYGLWQGVAAGKDGKCQ